MKRPASELVMVVMLENLVQQALPRTLAIRQKLERGEVLLASEVEFFIEMLDRFRRCERDFMQDEHCKIIFTTVAHILYEVANMAMKNESEKD